MNTNNIPRLYGSKEFAQLLGISQQNLSKMKERGKLPAPIQVLAATSVWTEDQVMKKYKEYKALKQLNSIIKIRKEMGLCERGGLK